MLGNLADDGCLQRPEQTLGRSWASPVPTVRLRVYDSSRGGWHTIDAYTVIHVGISQLGRSSLMLAFMKDIIYKDASLRRNSDVS